MKIFLKRLPAAKLRLVIHSVGVLVFIVFSSLILLEASKATVAVAYNGEKQTVKTHSDTVEELLEELGIDIGEHDKLSLERNAEIMNGMSIEYQQAKKLLLTIDGEQQEYYTTADTIESFLAEENLTFSGYDEVSHDPEEEIEKDLHITVQTAYQLTINDGGKKTKVWTTGGSIKEVLAENQITLNKIDKVKPGLDKDVDEETKVAITRVEKDTDSVEESVAFKVNQKKDNSLDKGKEKVIEKGQKGTVVKKYEIIKENGKEVSRKLVSEKVKKESKDQLVAVGTKEIPTSENVVTLASETKNPSNNSSSNGSSSNVSSAPKTTESSNSSNTSSEPGGKVLHMEATAFTAECNGCSGYTATGINLNANRNMKVIAVDPNVIPLGSKVWVEGYGNAIAGDTGGAIKGNRIDAHVPTKSAANSFGRKKVKVKIIE